jgi:hypothetical protein
LNDAIAVSIAVERMIRRSRAPLKAVMDAPHVQDLLEELGGKHGRSVDRFRLKLLSEFLYFTRTSLAPNIVVPCKNH